MKTKCLLILLVAHLGRLSASAVSPPVQTNATIFCNEPDGIGQSFIMPEEAWITGIKLKMKNYGNYSPSDCRIELQIYTNAAISLKSLRSTEISANDIPAQTADWVDVHFDPPYHAEKNQQLAWIYRINNNGNTIGLSEGNPYQDGCRFFRYPDGSVGISGDLDFAFIVIYTNQISGYDFDGDNLPDSWEDQYFGNISNANPTELCANGINTIREAYIAGLNPVDPASQFTIFINSGNILQWQCETGRVYSILWTTNLLETFKPLKTNIAWTCSSFTNSMVTSNAYFRLSVQLEE